MEQASERELLLIKFEPEEVLFQHRETRTVYRYFNLAEAELRLHALHHPALLRGAPFNRGVLYVKEDSDLQLEIEQRNRSFRMEHFSEEEIANTFLPLLRLLHLLHQEGLAHRSVSLQNIVIVEGEVRLRDWLAVVPGRQAGQNKLETDDKEEDLLALGRCMLNCTFLTIAHCSSAEWEQRLLSVIQKFSKNFIIVLLIFAKQLRPHYQHAASILEGESKRVDSQLCDLYEGLRQQERKRALKDSPKNADSKVALSPARRVGAGHKKTAHHENIQNKGEGERKLERGKIGEKSSPSIQEVMSKRLNEEEKRLKEETLKRGKEKTIINLSNFGVENNSKKVGFKDRNSPLHKLRPYSKRK